MTPTLTVRRANDRGHADHGWLKSAHTFSFAGYSDPKHMGYRALRVINDDRVEPGRGFGTHSHQDMEIISYVLSGELSHKDSMGTGSVIRPGDVQRMTAGTGVSHSEFNPSQANPVHFLQIWILPESRGIKPSYEQKNFPTETRDGQFALVASRDGHKGSLIVHQDVRLYAGLFAKGQSAEVVNQPDRFTWLHVAKGSAKVGELLLQAGDAVSFNEAGSVTLTGVEQSEVLWFDLG